MQCALFLAGSVFGVISVIGSSEVLSVCASYVPSFPSMSQLNELMFAGTSAL